jgi:hypothetical protein
MHGGCGRALITAKQMVSSWSITCGVGEGGDSTRLVIGTGLVVGQRCRREDLPRQRLFLAGTSHQRSHGTNTQRKADRTSKSSKLTIPLDPIMSSLALLRLRSSSDSGSCKLFIAACHSKKNNQHRLLYPGQPARLSKLTARIHHTDLFEQVGIVLERVPRVERFEDLGGILAGIGDDDFCSTRLCGYKRCKWVSFSLGAPERWFRISENLRVDRGSR